jgi:hypothetical protein
MEHIAAIIGVEDGTLVYTSISIQKIKIDIVTAVISN